MASQGRQSDAGLFADWRPDWLSQPDATPRRSTNDHLHGGPAPSDRNSVRMSSISNGNSSAGDTFRNAEDPEAAKEEDPSALTPARYEVETTQDKAVKYVTNACSLHQTTYMTQSASWWDSYFCQYTCKALL